MGGNLVILEIKPVDGSRDAITQDLRKLTAFCLRAGYHLGILLLFGDIQGGIGQPAAEVCELGSTG